MLHLIVHADDFGLSEKVNEGILESHLNGILTSTSIMATGSAFDHAISIAKSLPSLDVGVHLTLVEEEPVLDSDTLPSLINKDGKFHFGAMEFTKRYMTGKICLQEVESELQAQITKVTNSGVNVSHLDSHQHLHMLPRVLNITVELAKKFGIHAIRIPKESVHVNMLAERRFFSRVPALLILRFFCHKARNMPVTRTDHFAGFFYGGNLHKKNLQKVIKHLPINGTCELMCHPGIDDPVSNYDHWGYHWSKELEALTNPVVSSLISSKGIKIISYRELP